MALACSSDSRAVPSGAIRCRGSSISVIIASTSRAGQSRDIKRVARRVRIGRGADHANDLVDIGDCDRKTDQDMGAVAGLVEQEFGAARDHLLAERDEQRQQVLQVHRLRTTLSSASILAGKFVCSGVKR